MNECLTHAISSCFSESRRGRERRLEGKKGRGIVGEVCDSVTHNIQFINL